VQADGTFTVTSKTYGPLAEDLARKQVDVDIQQGVVEVFYERELRARFDQETGDELNLDDDMRVAAVSVSPQQEEE
jgi:N utilization substance protein A